LGGYHTIDPVSPWNPAKGRHGIGAWELAVQYSTLQIGSSVVNAGFSDQALNATRLDQVMVGVNWWPTRAVRWSLDYVYDKTNKPVDVGGGQIRDNYSIFWTRLGMFF
jgi:phosphate-selective porin OprO/OprP